MNNQAQLIIETNNLSKQNTSHILHLLLSMVSLGIWVPIWIMISISNAIERGKTERKITKLADD